MDGILLIDKPEGWTSFDVVAKVRGIIRTGLKKELEKNSSPTTNYHLPSTKVGHTGTLDPAATGLMIIVVGSYCKRAAEFSKLDKTYQVELTLGKTSTTADKEGNLTEVSTSRPPKKDVVATLESFVGKQLQTPPSFSAVKVGGQRAYKLARAGKEVVIQPREVNIYSIEDIKYEYPHVWFTSSVSSGTYIRSLAVDIGQKLTTGAYMSNLKRTTVGQFDIKDALTLDSIDFTSVQSSLKH